MGRTTMLCGKRRDGPVQKLDASHQRTPYHFRCRTAQIGCDKDGKLDAMRPFVADNRPVKDIPKDQRDGKIGQVDANTTYKEWFDRQDESFQKEWLGSSKYKLYSEVHNELIGGGFARSKFIQDQISVPADMIQAQFGKNFKIEEGKVVAYGADGQKIFSRTAHQVKSLTLMRHWNFDWWISNKDSILKGSSRWRGFSGVGGQANKLMNMAVMYQAFKQTYGKVTVELNVHTSPELQQAIDDAVADGRKHVATERDDALEQLQVAQSEY
ncbi:hypothetical protein FQR65_LT19952 [Abscondita terminalis]|nr:hypothetical protein FQR65_LT19952 [Abscondita terminalis]